MRGFGLITALFFLISIGGKAQEQEALSNYLKGLQFLKLNNHEEAIIYFKDVLDKKPDFDKAHWGIGIAFCRASNYKEAEFHFKRAIELNPKEGDFYLSYAACLEKKGPEHYQRSLELYKQASSLLNTAMAYHQLGSMYQKLGHCAEAIDAFKKAIELDRGYIIAYNNIGSCLLVLGKATEAIKFYQDAIRNHSNLSGLSFYFNLGVAYLTIGDMAKAEASFLLETAINPSHLDAHLNLGNIYQIDGRFEDAIIEYKEVLSIDPKNYQALSNLAQLYLSTNELQKAKLTVERLISYYPKSGKAHFLLGKIYATDGDKRKAWKEYERALNFGYRPEGLSGASKD